MQPNWQQQQGYGYGQFGGGQPGQQQPQQTGLQQPQPTGFQPRNNMAFLNNPPSSFSAGMASQPTGFSGMGQQQTGQPTGGYGNFSGGGMGGMNPQMTGYPGGGASGMMSQPTGFQGGGGMMSQPTGMGFQSTGGGGGMMPQQTGFAGLRAQPTGFQDPRLASMMQSFMPSNASQPFNSSGMPQFNQTPQNQPLQQTFQSLLQNPSVKTPKVPWVLTKQEKKDYDQIFRAWEKGDGFVSGETAREVFGQSGLSQDDMIKIWTLADVDNRGKLNLPEFHVAMGLIYRALNGNEIPDKLPEELIPPSMRDIDTTVNFMRDLLKHESNTRSNTASPAYGSSASAPSNSKDATAYKHDDTRAGSTYKPSSRHLDRKSVRYAGEDSNADIGDIRRQLQNTSALLDKSSSDYERKTEEDERLEQEVDDLKYRVKRLQEDIDYVSKGRRSADKDQERRKLERELLFLMHEKLPELERRQEQREEERKMEERAGIRARDRRNETHGRYDDRDRDRDRDRDDHSWLKGTYDRDRRDSRDRDRDRDYSRRDDRDRDRDRDYDRRDSYDRRDRDRSRDRSRERPRSPPASRTPPPVPPPAPATSTAAPPAPPKAGTAASVPNTKNMTPEQRTAFIREQAQRRIQDRLKALGVESAPATEEPAVDKSVEERLAQEKKEAEEKSRSADEEFQKREQARQARLAGGKSPAPEAAKETPKEAPKAPEPKSILKGKAAPPPPVSRGKAAQPAASPASTPKVETPQEEEDPEEAEFKRREEAIKKAKEDRRRRLAELEKEEEEERQREEEATKAKSAKSPAAEEPRAASPAPAAPPAPPAPGGYNPFRKPGAGAAASGATPSPAAPANNSASFNPFFKPQNASNPASNAGTPSVTSPPAAPPAPPAPAPPPAPPAPAAPVFTARSAANDDGWESIHEKEADSDEDSSDDDDYATSRNHRRNLASALFGGLGGGGSSSSPVTSRPGSAAPKPPAALKNLGGGDPNAGRGALLSAIQGGARLKKAQTVVKGQPEGGKVIGDAAPPPHINNAPRELESSGTGPGGGEEEESFKPRNDNRQSVDWYAGLAADQSHPAASFEPSPGMQSTKEEEFEGEEFKQLGVHDEADQAGSGGAPEIKVNDEDELADFDMTKSIRVRTLYPYEGQRDVDLTFKEDVVVVAHPAKDSSSPWWYGMVVDGGSKGWFPHEYVEEIKPVKARALYSYAGTTEEELPFAEGDELDIVDKSAEDWWKTEKAGVIFLVPATYFEVIG